VQEVTYHNQEWGDHRSITMESSGDLPWDTAGHRDTQIDTEGGSRHNDRM
jgi:hypothetical protein